MLTVVDEVKCKLCGSTYKVFQGLCQDCEDQQYEEFDDKDYKFRKNEWE